MDINAKRRSLAFGCFILSCAISLAVLGIATKISPKSDSDPFFFIAIWGAFWVGLFFTLAPFLKADNQ